MKHAERSKKYLVGKRGLEPQRLLIVDGGYRNSSVTELHLYPIGSELSGIYLWPDKDPND
jgi:hypothetical protein